jgi:hypothetical protein
MQFEMLNPTEKTRNLEGSKHWNNREARLRSQKDIVKAFIKSYTSWRQSIRKNRAPPRYEVLQVKTANRHLTLKERKEIVLFHTPPQIQQNLLKQTDRILNATISRRDCVSSIGKYKCWLYRGCPSQRNGRIVVKAYYFPRSTWALQYGIAVLRFRFKKDVLTEAQKQGIIHEGWHLSHLCGNWRCLNSRHFTVEPADVNLSRNGCFNDRNCQTHSWKGSSDFPRCMIQHHVYESEALC